MSTLRGWVSMAEGGAVENQTDRDRLKVLVESDEIAFKAVHHVVHVFAGHGRIYHQVLRRGRTVWIIRERIDDGAGERERRVPSPDVVRGWIRPDHVFETAGVNLVIVVGVTPAADAVRRVIKEGGVINVVRV